MLGKWYLHHKFSCKNQDDREFNRKKDGNPQKIYFIDFQILFCFADFFLKNISNVTKINVNWGKTTQWGISVFTYFSSFWSDRQPENTTYWGSTLLQQHCFREIVCCLLSHTDPVLQLVCKLRQIIFGSLCWWVGCGGLYLIIISNLDWMLV